MLPVNLLRFGDGRIYTVVGEKRRVLGNWVHDVKSAAGWLTVGDETFGVGSGGGGLVVGFLVVPGDALDLVVREDSKGLG